MVSINKQRWDSYVNQAREKVAKDPGNTLWHKHHAIVWAADHIIDLSDKISWQRDHEEEIRVREALIDALQKRLEQQDKGDGDVDEK